ncbi:MAG: CDP-alcohol phosphatidyltransferase family protein [Anaerolineales bacterium]
MANAITLARLPLLFVIVALLYGTSPTLHLMCVPLLILLILMDSLDGYVARHRHESSVVGSVLDIMVDRIVEQVLWVVYAHLRLVPVAIPLLFIIRGVLVDTLRNTQVSEGVSPFQIMATRWGKFLVGSPAMRSSYAVVKLLSFSGLAATLAARGLWGVEATSTQILGTSSLVLSWMAAALCLARGIPVIVEAGGKLLATGKR